MKTVLIVVGIIIAIYIAYLAVNSNEKAIENSSESNSSTTKFDPSWDADGDGINDCEKDGTCDDSVDYSMPRQDMMGDTNLKNKLSTSASITNPENNQPMTLTGAVTESNGTTITFGNIAMPFPYTQNSSGQNGVTTLNFEKNGVTGVYLVMFTPGEASWQALDLESLGENVNVSDIKVVGEEITVVVDGNPLMYSFQGGKFFKK